MVVQNNPVAGSVPSAPDLHPTDSLPEKMPMADSKLARGMVVVFAAIGLVQTVVWLSRIAEVSLTGASASASESDEARVSERVVAQPPRTEPVVAAIPDPVPAREPVEAEGVLHGKVGEFLDAATMDRDDKKRLLRVNNNLKRSRLATIPEGHVISAEDMEAFRAWVDDAERLVDRATDKWGSVHSAVLAPLSKQVLEQLTRGETAGLQRVTKEDPGRRQHPHEAVSVVQYGGGAYVLRVSPYQDQRLMDIGSELDQAVEHRARTYDSNVRSLFRPR
jgi:hypothetical protein